MKRSGYAAGNQSLQQLCADACAIQELSVVTANVGTMHPKSSDFVRQGDGGFRVTGRMAVMEAQFCEHGFHIVGVQEHRLQGECDRNTEHYHIIQTGATQKGTH
eukprot:6153630-Karenia_brevis.AAC.1